MPLKAVSDHMPLPESSLLQVDLAEKLWNLHWSKFLPHSLSDTIRVEKVSYEEATAFANQQFPLIYDALSQEQKFGEDRDPHIEQARKRYYEYLGDFFVFFEQDKKVGMAICSVLDWSSYNFRNIALLPNYQGHGIYLKFTELLCEILKKHHVKRLEGEVAPSNRQHIHALNKMGYTVTAMTLSERWGALLHIVKYLDEKDEDKFRKLYDGPYNSSSNRQVRNK